MPSYSVLMPVYARDSPTYLAQAIDSMLAQSHPTADFVVVKDGPLGNDLDDLLSAYAETHPGVFSIVALPRNLGAGLARAQGLAACRHEWVALLDADDIAAADRIERQCAFLGTHPDADVIGSNAILFDGDIAQGREFTVPETVTAAFAKKRCPFVHPSLFFRKSVVQAAGSYRAYPRVEDYDLAVRLIQSGAHCFNVQEPLVYWRAGRGYYERRGGLALLRDQLKFRWDLYRRGFYTLPEWMAFSAVRVVLCLAPAPLRQKLYEIGQR